MVQERLQQQLTGAKAACKVSDSRQTDMLTQHEAQIADLQAQIEASHQQISELEAAHQQSISDHMATVDTCDQQEADAQRQHAMHAAYVHEQVTAGERLRLEVATAAEEAEQHMAAVAAYTGALQQAYCHSQTELIQELQQLATDVADFQTACSSNIAGVPGQGSVNEVLTRLVDMQSAVEGRSGLQGLLDEHIRIKSQVSCMLCLLCCMLLHHCMAGMLLLLSDVITRRLLHTQAGPSSQLGNIKTHARPVIDSICLAKFDCV